MARVVQPFDGVPDGQVYPRRFEIGEEILGELGKVAVREGAAVEHGSGLPYSEFEAAAEAEFVCALTEWRPLLSKIRSWLARLLKFTP